MDTNKIYTRTDSAGIVIKLFSSVFESPQEGDILIEEGNEDYHAHVHLKYQLMDKYGRYNYRMAGGQMTEIPEGEKPLIPPPPPSLEERITAAEIFSTDLDLANIENGIMNTDLDLRLLALEAAL